MTSATMVQHRHSAAPALRAGWARNRARSLMIALAAILAGGTLSIALGHGFTNQGTALSGTASQGWSAVPLGARDQISGSLGSLLSGYRLSRQDGAWVARSRAQKLSARFTPSGALFTSGTERVGLSLEGARARPTVSANRVVYAFGDVRERFSNGPLGIEQAFTVMRPLGGRGLTLALRVTGNARATRTAGGIAFERDGVRGLAYRDLEVVDAAGRRLAARLSLAAGRIEIHVDTAGAAYPITVDPTVEQWSSTVPGGADIESLAVSDDGSTVAIGSIEGQAEPGEVFIYQEPAGGWAAGSPSEETLKDPGGSDPDSDNDLYGASVALSPTGTTLFVGSPGCGGCSSRNPTVDDQGNVYEYSYSGGAWSKTATLSDSGLGQFGDAVGLSADGSTLAVVAYCNTDEFDDGANCPEDSDVVVYTEPSGGWAATTPTATTIELSSQLGAGLPSVALSSDGSVIATGSSGSGTTVLSEGSSGWSTAATQARLAAVDAGGNPIEGPAAISADGSVIAVGDSSENPGDDSPDASGVVEVFTEPAGGWVTPGSGSIEPVAAIYDSASTELGYSVAISGDGSTLYASTAGAMIGNPDSGNHVDVFTEPAGGWASAAPGAAALEPPTADALGGFALSSDDSTLAVAGDILDAEGDESALFVYSSSTTGPGAGTTTSTTSTTGTSSTTSTTGTSSSGTTTSTAVLACGSGGSQTALCAAGVGTATTSSETLTVPVACDTSASDASCGFTSATLGLADLHPGLSDYEADGYATLGQAVHAAWDAFDASTGTPFANDLATAARARKRKRVPFRVYGKARLTVAAGREGHLELKLSASGKRLLKQHRKLTLILLVARKQGGRTFDLKRQTVTFRAPKKKRR